MSDTKQAIREWWATYGVSALRAALTKDQWDALDAAIRADERAAHAPQADVGIPTPPQSAMKWCPSCALALHAHSEARVRECLEHLASRRGDAGLDTARLDWLEDNRRTYWIELSRQPDGALIYAGPGSGLRAAIDAASGRATNA